MLEYAHHIRKKEGGITSIIYIYELVGTIEILLRPHCKVQRCRLVHRILHLVDMPVCSQKGCIGDTHVCADIFHFLGIPERECIIVTVSNEDTVRANGIEIVLRHLHSCITVASVMVIPVFGSHKDRHSEKKNCDGRSSHSFLALQAFLQP